MNRADFQSLAEVRIVEAKALLDLNLFDGAYYLAGYAVECGLEACICARILAGEFPPRKDFSAQCFSHDLNKRADLADLIPARESDVRANPRLGSNWITVKDWNEQSRYNRYGESEARALYGAVADPSDGVMPWIRIDW